MKTHHILLPGILAILLFSCKDEPVKPEMKNIVLTPVQKSMLSAGNEFAFHLLQQVNNGEKAKDQFFISPYSAAEALSMTLNGAAGATSDSMVMVLGYSGMDSATINGYCKTLRTTLLSVDPKVKLAIANSIWYQQDFYVLPDFIQTNASYFDAVVQELNFFDPGAKDIINAWIETKTNGRIEDMIKEIEPDIVMFLINALWFKGEWSSRFETGNTKQENFYPFPGASFETPMMHQKQTYNYFANNLVQIAELPYGRGNFAMTILLPADGKTVDDVIAELSPENWDSWIHSLSEQKLVLTLPKLKFEYELKMNDALKALGMGIAFCEGCADFTRINPDGGLYISYVQQNTFLEVNEAGSEAAAATVVAVGKTSAGPDEEISFVVNKPYLFMITERSTGAILFSGRINKPTY
ncbi:MAG: serpin family protein [Bacteroidales bacterium]